MQELILRGRHVLTNAARRADGVLADGAIVVRGDTITEVGEWRSLRKRHPRARVLGNGAQLLMPGLIDAHSHGRG